MSTAPTRDLIVCADDFGASDAACRAIAELGACGAISAASCLVDAPCCASRAGELRAVTGLSIGLHLDLTEFTPAPLRANLRDWLIRGFVLRSVDRAAVLREVRRQLQRFEDVFDRPPAFADGHCHVHQIPGVREPLLEELLRRYGRSVAVRSTRSLRHRGFKQSCIAELGGRALQALISRLGFHSNSDFAGAYDFRLEACYPRLMQQWLMDIADGGLIMCHPERIPGGAARQTARQSEYSFLASPQWRSTLAQHGVRLRPFSAL